MPLPSSGPLSLNDIQTEFGGSNPISLNEYYAGGGLVPAGTTGTNGAVPSSGAISIFNFYGTSNVVPYWSENYNIGGNPAAYPQGRPYVVGGNLLWAEQDYTGNPQITYINSINASTGALNYRRSLTSVYISGTFFGSYTASVVDSSGNWTIAKTVNNGKAQFFRVNSSGTIVWSRILDTYPPTFYTTSSNGIDVDSSGNTYILGYRTDTGGNPFARLIKLDSSGVVVWTREIAQATYASVSSGVAAIRVSPTGDIVVCLTGRDASWFRPLILRYDTNANFLSGIVISPVSGTGNTYMGPITFDSSGNIYGWFQGSAAPVAAFQLNSALALQWLVSISGVSGGQNQIEIDSSNNIYIPVSQANQIYGVVSLTSAGVFRWATNIQAGPSPSNNVYLNNLGIAVQGTTALFTLTNRFNASVGLNSGVIGKFPTDRAYTGFYPAGASTATEGINVGVNTAPSSVTNIASSYSIISVTPTNTTVTYTTSAHTSPTVGTVTPTITNGAYTPVSTYGSYFFTIAGVYSWIVPANITTIAAVAVGGGGGASSYAGGGGGGLGYGTYTVTPGATVTVTVGSGGSGGLCTQGNGASSSVGYAGGTGIIGAGATGSNGGSYGGAGGGVGGQGWAFSYGGGGGAAGYTGNGGQGSAQSSAGQSGFGGGGGGGSGANYSFTCGVQPGGGSGGGVGLIGEGPSGSGGQLQAGQNGSPGSYGSFFSFGGGGGSGGYYIANFGCPCNEFYVTNSGGSGGPGGVRIMYSPGGGRNYPSTNTRPL
jgi:hypothetical protein